VSSNKKQQPATLAEIRQWPATVGATDAARALGVSPSHLRELGRRGECPVRALPLGSSLRYVTADLIRLLSGGTEAA